MKKKETDPSLKPPSEWFKKMEKDIKKGNPSYSQDKIDSTIGDIWYNKLDDKKRKEIRERYGKKYGAAPKMKNGGNVKDQYEGNTPREIWGNWKPKQRMHFLDDHFADEYDFHYKDRLVNDTRFDDLPLELRSRLLDHVHKGQYKKGGPILSEFVKHYSNHGALIMGGYNFDKMEKGGEITKSKAASKVLQLMDKDYSYGEALEKVLSEDKTLDKKALEKELYRYI